jgi:hypothetical protein
MRMTPRPLLQRRVTEKRRQRARWKGRRGQRPPWRRRKAEAFIAEQTRSWRLARACALAWADLPDPDRRTLLRFWKYGAGDGWHFLPRIKRPASLEANGQPAMGTCSPDGRTLCFHATLTEVLPVEALVAVVQHELMHVLQLADGLPVDEAEANAAMDEWKPEWTVIAARVLGSRPV